MKANSNQAPGPQVIKPTRIRTRRVGLSVADYLPEFRERVIGEFTLRPNSREIARKHGISSREVIEILILGRVDLRKPAQRTVLEWRERKAG